jgi:hypothetical protein
MGKLPAALAKYKFTKKGQPGPNPPTRRKKRGKKK